VAKDASVEELDQELNSALKVMSMERLARVMKNLFPEEPLPMLLTERSAIPLPREVSYDPNLLQSRWRRINNQ